MRSFDNFLNESTQNDKIVNDLYTERIVNKVQTIHLSYKEKGLLNSTLYTSFHSLVNPYMRSNKHKDWLVIEQACDVLKSVVKDKAFFTKEEIENDLENATSLQDIEAVFKDYAKKIY